MRDFRSSNYALVFDVNTLIDAVDQSSRHHDAAVRALASTEGQPLYFSDHMLSTTAHELLRLGAEPEAVQEYLEFVSIPEEDYGPQIHAFKHIEFKDYDVYDRHGNPDHEDATIVSLMDAAEDHAKKPSLLVTTDGGLQEWCVAHRRDVTFPGSLPRVLNQHDDPMQASSFEYTARQMFPQGTQSRTQSTPDIRATSKAVVKNVRAERQSRRPTYTPSIDIDYGDDDSVQYD